MIQDGLVKFCTLRKLTSECRLKSCWTKKILNSAPVHLIWWMTFVYYKNISRFLFLCFNGMLGIYHQEIIRLKIGFILRSEWKSFHGYRPKRYMRHLQQGIFWPEISCWTHQSQKHQLTATSSKRPERSFSIENKIQGPKTKLIQLSLYVFRLPSCKSATTSSPFYSLISVALLTTSISFGSKGMLFLDLDPLMHSTWERMSSMQL